MLLNKIISTLGIALSIPYAVVGMFQNTICSVTEGYVIDNKQQSKVVLCAHYANKGLFAEDIYIDIQDSISGKTILTIKPSIDSGYKPSVQLIQTQSGGVSDILLTMDSGGSGGGGYTFLYSVFDGKVTTLFDGYKYAEDNKWMVQFTAGYIAKVNKGKECYNIDLSGKGEDWLTEVYDDQGNVISNVQPYVGDNLTVFAYYNGTKGVFQLQVWRPIIGLYNADRLGYVVEQLERVGNAMFSYYNSVSINQSQCL